MFSTQITQGKHMDQYESGNQQQGFTKLSNSNQIISSLYFQMCLIYKSQSSTIHSTNHLQHSQSIRCMTATNIEQCSWNLTSVWRTRGFSHRFAAVKRNLTHRWWHIFSDANPNVLDTEFDIELCNYLHNC